ncbi:MAG: flagellar hook-basal body complex protein [Candidatus Sericytochromatia bacterium]
MTNLGIAGGVSLRTVNQWISVIDTNLTNSKRIGYKEVRADLTSGEVSRYGTTQSIGKIQEITFPSASLEIGRSQILDYVQGNLTQTGQIADFALSGRGYFVVEDNNGNKYATRDGQFMFDSDGYLVTAEGLRVLTTGLDYIRVPASELFSVNTKGESDSTTIDPTQINTTFNPASGVSSLRNSTYGNKKLLVIDIPTESKLLYSKYGYTKFDIGTKIPIRIQNDFSEVTDGIDTSLIPNNMLDTGFATGTVTANPALAKKMADYFRHDTQNGVLRMSTHDVGGTQNRYVQAALTSQQVKDFNFEMDYNLRDNATGLNTNFGITIGKSSHSSTDQGDGIFIGAGLANQLVIRTNGVIVAASVLGPTFGDSPTALTLNPALKFTLKVNSTNGVITAQLFQNNVAVSALLTYSSKYNGGYMSVGTSAIPAGLAGSSSTPSDNVIDITNIDLVERAKDSEYVVNIVQKNKKDILKNGLNADEEETQVIQQYLEESTSTLADTLPMLSNAQKLFTAISKIISVYNSITDDMNNTIR